MSSALIEYNRVSKSYPTPLGRRSTPVFTDVSLHLDEREIVGVCGPSGCGKSTLLRMFFGLVSWQTGQIRYRGQDVVGLSRTARRRIHREVQVVFQDPRNAFNPRWLLRQSLLEPFRLFRLGDPPQAQEVIAEQLGLLGLEEGLLDRYPHQLSGGQLQRLALARCLVVSPRCLFLDEASSMLDVSVQAQMMALVRRLCEEQGISVLLISHDLDLVEAMSQRIYRFEDGRLSPGAGRPATGQVEE